jgi:hypothetical protein
MNNLRAVLPKVIISKDNTTLTFDPVNRIYDFNLISLDIELNIDSSPSIAKFVVEDSNAIDLGYRIDIWLGKVPYINDKIFSGTIDVKKRSYNRNNHIVTEYKAKSLGYKLSERIIDIVARQRIKEDGLPDSNDQSTEVSNLVKRIIADITAYPKVNDAMQVKTLYDEGIDPYMYVKRSGITLPVYILQYRPAIDALQELAEISGYIFFVDADGKLHFHAPGINSNIITFKDSINTNDNLSTTGLIVDYELEDSIEQVKNVIYGLGGNRPKISKEVTVSNGYQLLTEYKAVKINLVGIERELQYIAVRVAKVGDDLTLPLEGELRLDDGNNRPKGALIKAFRKDYQAINAKVGSSNGQWVLFDVGEENLDVNTPHWLILYKKGYANSTYAWYHDNSTIGVNARSSDGVSWIVNNNSYQFNYRLYYSQRLLTPIADNNSINAYGRREAVVSWPTVIEDVELIALTKGQLETAKKRKQFITLTCIPADTMLRLGDAIRVVDSINGLDAVFDVTNISYSFDQGLGDYNYKFTVKGVRFI